MGEELSVWGLIANASLLVQFVMATLVMASITSWVVIFQRTALYRRTAKAAKRFEARFWSGMDLNQLFRESTSTPAADCGMEDIFRSGFKEFTRLRQQAGVDPDAIMEGAQRAMRVAATRQAEKLESNLSFLATVGSTSPYIGLFGTVWGIMNSFRGLAQLQQATIATVAPGISEALIATAMGLFAAIPAVIAYNRFATRVDSLATSYQTFAEEFSSILHRRAHTPSSAGAA